MKKALKKLILLFNDDFEEKVYPWLLLLTIVSFVIAFPKEAFYLVFALSVMIIGLLIAGVVLYQIGTNAEKAWDRLVEWARS